MLSGYVRTFFHALLVYYIGKKLAIRLSRESVSLMEWLWEIPSLDNATHKE
jgi:hypothetical protein